MRRALLAAGIVVTLAVRGHATCVGDCNGDGGVTVDELIRGVNVALGNASAGSCPSFDLNSDGSVTINELINAVNVALAGCGSGLATATPTATPSPMGATPTSVPSCSSGAFAVTFSDVSAGSNVTSEPLALGKGAAVDAAVGNGRYTWAIQGDACAKPLGETVRAFAINVSDAATRLLPGTYAITPAGTPFIRVDYHESKVVLVNPSQSFSHQWLSTGGTLEIRDAGGGAINIHARRVTVEPAALTPSAAGTFTLDIEGTVGTVAHN